MTTWRYDILHENDKDRSKEGSWSKYLDLKK